MFLITVLLLLLTEINAIQRFQLKNQTGILYYTSRYDPQLFPSDCYNRYEKEHVRVLSVRRSYPRPKPGDLLQLATSLMEILLPYRLPAGLRFPLDNWIAVRKDFIDDIIAMEATWDLLQNDWMGCGQRFLDLLLTNLLVNVGQFQKQAPYGDTESPYDMEEPAWNGIIAPFLDFIKTLTKHMPFNSHFGRLLFSEQTAMRLSALLGSPDHMERQLTMLLIHIFFQKSLAYCDLEEDEEESVQRARRIMISIVNLLHEALASLHDAKPSDMAMRASRNILDLLNLMVQEITALDEASFSSRLFDQILRNIYRDRVLPLFGHRHFKHFREDWQSLYDMVFTILADTTLSTNLQEAFLTRLFQNKGDRSREIASLQFIFLIDVFLQEGPAWLPAYLLPLFFERIFAELRTKASRAVRYLVLKSFLDDPFSRALQQPPLHSPEYLLASAQAFLSPLFDWFLDQRAFQRLRTEEPAYDCSTVVSF